MGLASGTRLGPYEIVGPLGAGGMGEVYKARDTRLNRDVALKTLPAEFAADESRRLRFEQEARAIAALNHPNIVAVHDVGAENGVSYIITELVDGEPLRGAKFGLKKTLDLATQVASGLAAAHAAGIVHRDLKPDNILITREGRAKILDFGLAKLHVLPSQAPAGVTQTIHARTEPGSVMGTVGYMSPEQVRGADTDQRSDIFSFGIILYEWLSGQRAFQGETSVETMTAILRQDPPELPETIPPGIRQIVAHCLEKEPANRYQSARDLAFSLESLATVTTTGIRALPPVPATRRIPWIWPAAILLLAAAFLAGRKLGSPEPSVPAFNQLTFRRGPISAARFTPDGQSIVYAAAWDGNDSDIYVTRRDYPESRTLGVPGATLLAVSSTSELAILVNQRLKNGFSMGTLARLPLAGGSPREILENVTFADWSADGKELAVIHKVDGKNRLEYPIGKVILSSDHEMSWPRLSPKGDRIALFEHPIPGDDRGFVAAVDLSGKLTRLVNTESSSEAGLSWSPSGDEVWFTAQYDRTGRVLNAVTLGGKQRPVLRAPGGVILHDAGRGGNLLVSRDDHRAVLMAFSEGDKQERDLTWLGQTLSPSLSADGRLLAFGEQNPVLGANYAVAVRKTDGSSPPTRLGEGTPVGISPDGKWILSVHPAHPGYFLIPVGAGQPRALQSGSVELVSPPHWFNDSSRISYEGAESGHKIRCYVQAVDPGALPQAVTPEDTRACVPASDGKAVGVMTPDQQKWLYPIDGGPRRLVTNLDPGDAFAGITPDGKSMYLYHRNPTGFTVKLFDLATFQKRPFREIQIADRAGLESVNELVLSQDGKTYAYFYRRLLSELYLVGGVH